MPRPAPVHAAVQAPDAAKEALLRVCAAEGQAMTPRLRGAFLAYARQQALSELEADGMSLPQEFLAAVDADPDVASSIYAVHQQPKDVLLWLYSLRLDLGEARFEKYHQLALAAANAESELHVPVPDLYFFDRQTLLAPAQVPAGALPPPPAPARDATSTCRTPRSPGSSTTSWMCPAKVVAFSARRSIRFE